MLDYTTTEGVDYKVYNAGEIDINTISQHISGSTYYDAHYEYAAETMQRAEKIAKTQKGTKAYYAAINNQKHKYISSIRCGFDIETTRIVDNEESYAYMYHWQFAINDLIICGRTWDDFKVFMNVAAEAIHTEMIKALNRAGKRWSKKCNITTIIWVANLPHEFEFIKDLFDWDAIFAKDTRKVITAKPKLTIKYRNDYKDITPFTMQDCLQISGGSLSFLASKFTKTQKRKGDLDYNTIRNSLTPLTPVELSYCYDDVAILSEWHDYYYNEYSKQGFAPITSTGILRHQVKMLQTPTDLLDVWNKFPDLSEYRYIMDYVFQGGYAHGNINHINTELDNVVYSRDITSSYPYVMLTYKFPMGKFLDDSVSESTFNNMSKDDLIKYFDTTQSLYYFELDFEDLESPSGLTSISISKTLNETEIVSDTKIYDTDGFGKSIIDNGKILRAKKVVCAATSYDIVRLLKIYNYSKLTFSHIMVCHNVDYLPDYLLQPIKKAYAQKCNLKKNHMSSTVLYQVSKALVNAGYGMTCTKMVLDEVSYNQYNRSWESNPVDKTWDKLVKTTFLNPLWGVFVTSYARGRLMDMVIEANENMVICDTDSMYYIKSDRMEKIFEAENQRVIAENKKIFTDPAFWDLGTWDKQSVDKNGQFLPYERFAAMGAKRYMLFGYNDGKYGWKQTIAGLPKGVLEKISNKHNIDPMDLFLGLNGLSIDADCAEKNTTQYHDSPHTHLVIDNLGNAEYMYEESSVAIVPITFNMTLSDLFIDALDFWINKNPSKLEQRRM